MRREIYRAPLALWLALVLLAAPAGAAGGGIEFPSSGRFILPAVENSEIFKQCSRSVPKQIDGYWDPAPSDIDKLESRLKLYLAGRKGLAPPARFYNRQYVGFKHKGKLYIYGNFYPSMPQSQLKNQDTLPVLVCDGGPSFWGIVYRVDTGQFQALTFNGQG